MAPSPSFADDLTDRDDPASAAGIRSALVTRFKERTQAEWAQVFDGTAFITLQAVGGLIFVISQIIIGIALIEARSIPSWIGIFLIVGVLPLLVPFPERPVIAGLIVEVPRGVMVAALGVLIRQRVGTSAGVRPAPAHA